MIQDHFIAYAVLLCMVHLAVHLTSLNCPLILGDCPLNCPLNCPFFLRLSTYFVHFRLFPFLHLVAEDVCSKGALPCCFGEVCEVLLAFCTCGETFLIEKLGRSVLSSQVDQIGRTFVGLEGQRS